MAISSVRAKGNYTVAVKNEILGLKVVNAAREDLGEIEDLVFDSRNSQVVYAILSFGGFLGLGDKHFAIPWAALDFYLADGFAILNMDKERLKKAPGFAKDTWPDMTSDAWGEEIHSFYGHRPYWELDGKDKR
jgi:hypothetical protein